MELTYFVRKWGSVVNCWICRVYSSWIFCSVEAGGASSANDRTSPQVKILNRRETDEADILTSLTAGESNRQSFITAVGRSQFGGEE